MKKRKKVSGKKEDSAGFISVPTEPVGSAPSDTSIFKPKALSEEEKAQVLEALHKGPGYAVVDLFDGPPPSSVLESLLKVTQDV
jgi:hypothetical protein